MREFSIPFRGLRRGLRPFTNPVPGEEALVECFNIEPTENFPVGHQRLLTSDISVPTVNHIGIKDQGNNVWYWVGGVALDAVIFDSIPDLVDAGFASVSVLTGTVPHWLQFSCVDAPATQMYIYPLEDSGDIYVDTSPPSIGTGYNAGAQIIIRSLSGRRHLLRVVSSGDIIWSVYGY